MLKPLLLAACGLLFSAAALAADNPRVLLTTSLGEIEIELDAEHAPISTQNFLGYVQSGFYNGTLFHRVIPGFMVQGGGFDAQMTQKKTGPEIKNEAQNGLRNTRGSVAMARTSAVDSATSQFFINHANNAFLDHGGRDFGYAVFGQVTRGMEVVDRIAQVPTGYQDVPRQQVLIIEAKTLD